MILDKNNWNGIFNRKYHSIKKGVSINYKKLIKQQFLQFGPIKMVENL
jgi:hypothetical protein